ncbi:MAG: DUF2085 domain-containing protein [Anaerolineales bacterium]|nr:DUF2085 domain-containing protein [Anaerolineales bacterium]
MLALKRSTLWLSRHWLGLAGVIWAGYAGLPWLAPLLMNWGWVRSADLIYRLYASQCHQLPERSFFLFGPQSMYSLGQIGAIWPNTDNLLQLRQFIGNSQMGWKVAWSDRMVAMYTSLFLFSLVYGVVRRRLPALSVWGFLLLAIIPMGLDGSTHLLSDLTGFGHGFRDTNSWLSGLTQQAWPASFYAGDALGSFNSWMRLTTGVLFGLGVVWFSYPYFDREFAQVAAQLDAQLLRRSVNSAERTPEPQRPLG